MDINDFIKIFVSCFEDADENQFTADTEFQDLDDWTSMTATILSAKIEAACGVELETEDMRDCDTIQDLFDLVKSNK